MILLLSTLHVSPIIFLSYGLLRKSQENVGQNITESRGRRCGSIAQLRSRNSDRVDSRKSRLSQIHDPPIFHLTPPLLRQHNPQKPSIIGSKTRHKFASKSGSRNGPNYFEIVCCHWNFAVGLDRTQSSLSDRMFAQNQGHATISCFPPMANASI